MFCTKSPHVFCIDGNSYFEKYAFTFSGILPNAATFAVQWIPFPFFKLFQITLDDLLATGREWVCGGAFLGRKVAISLFYHEYQHTVNCLINWERIGAEEIVIYAMHLPEVFKHCVQPSVPIQTFWNPELPFRQRFFHLGSIMIKPEKFL